LFFTGIVKKDPRLPTTVTMPPPSPRQEVSVFDNEDTSKEQEKMDKESRRVSTIQEVKNCTSQLGLLLNQQHTQHTPEMQELYERCDRLRSNLFRLASDTVNNDEALVSPVKSYHLIDFSVLGDDAPCGQVEQNTTLLQEEEQQKIHDSSRTPLSVKSYLDDLLQLEDTENIMSEMGQSDITHNASVFTMTDSELRSRSTANENQPITSSGVHNPRPLSSLADINVSLDSIKPKSPPSHPDVAVIIISAVNTSPLPVSDFLFLAAVPKIELSCEVVNVGPGRILSVRWSRADPKQNTFTIFHESTVPDLENEKKNVSRTVNVTITPTREDDGAQYQCEALLNLNQPLVFKSEKPITISVHYKKKNFYWLLFLLIVPIVLGIWAFIHYRHQRIGQYILKHLGVNHANQNADRT
ncbi:vascular cell adhesion protein 1, partial [Silurus meridionalis]